MIIKGNHNQGNLFFYTYDQDNIPWNQGHISQLESGNNGFFWVDIGNTDLTNPNLYIWETALLASNFLAFAQQLICAYKKENITPSINDFFIIFGYLIASKEHGITSKKGIYAPPPKSFMDVCKLPAEFKYEFGQNNLALPNDDKINNEILIPAISWLDKTILNAPNYYDTYKFIFFFAMYTKEHLWLELFKTMKRGRKSQIEPTIDKIKNNPIFRECLKGLIKYAEFYCKENPVKFRTELHALYIPNKQGE